jgi:hypothetical protein
MIIGAQNLISFPFYDHVDRNTKEPSFKLAGPEAIDAAMDTAPNADQKKSAQAQPPLEVSPLIFWARGAYVNIVEIPITLSLCNNALPWLHYRYIQPKK